MFTVSFFDHAHLEDHVLAVGVDSEVAADTAYKACLAWFPVIVRDFLLGTVPVSRLDLATKGSALKFLKSTFGASPENFRKFWSDLTEWCIITSDMPDDLAPQSKYPGNFNIVDTSTVEVVDFDEKSSL